MSSSPRFVQLSPISMIKPILPRQDSLVPSLQHAQASSITDETPGDVPQPRRRGRKPGPLSRSAREAQRKLNHSIIEKARRTKINEALAALRQLVPPDYAKRREKDSGVSVSDVENDEEDEDDDGDGEYGAPRRNAVSANKKNQGGKKEEKEFKLEVLERTVAYLQDLTQQYDDLQEQLQSKRQCHCHEQEEISQPTNRKRSRTTVENPASGILSESTTTNERPTKRHEPLPPISSWLPLSPDSTYSTTDALPQGSKRINLTPLMPPYLPTPPSSALFVPTQTPISPLSTTSTKSSYIPSLSLGPTALPLPSSTTQVTTTRNTRCQSVSQSPPSHPSPISAKSCVQSKRIDTSPALSCSSYHTPEDENAASLLLTMRLLGSPTSPRRAPASSPLMPATTTTPTSMGAHRPNFSDASNSPSSLMLPLPERSTMPSQSKNDEREYAAAVPRHPIRENKMDGLQQVIVETPGSLLGLTGYRNRSNFERHGRDISN